MSACQNMGQRFQCHLSAICFWPVLLYLLGNAIIAESRSFRLDLSLDKIESGRHILASVQAGNPGCPKGEVGWANCGSALDTKSQTCIDGHTCSLGEQLCGVTCYDPAQLGCTGGVLSSTPGGSDGSETRNCTSPEPHSGPVGCNGDGCPIETGPPVAPAPAPLSATTPVSTATTAAAAALGSTGSTDPDTTSTNGRKNNVNVGAIVAGSIGATVLLAVIGGVVVVFVHRRRQNTKPLAFKEMKKEVPFENMPGQDMNPSHAVY